MGALATVMSVLLLGCSDPTGAGALRYALPRFDQGLDPADLRPHPPMMVYACDRWMIDQPEPEERLLLDVVFHRLSPDFPEDRPLPIHRAMVRGVGGEVVYQHRFPAYRVWIEARNVPRLHRMWPSIELRPVSDPTRFDWLAFVGYEPGYTISMEDDARIAALGGAVEARLTTSRMLLVTIPDRSTTALRSRSEVAFVDAHMSWYDCASLEEGA